MVRNLVRWWLGLEEVDDRLGELEVRMAAVERETERRGLRGFPRDYEPHFELVGKEQAH